MGLSLEILLKNKDKTCSPPWKHIACEYIGQRIAQWFEHWRHNKKQSVSWLWGSTSFTLTLNFSIMYVAFFSSFTHMRGTVNNIYRSGETVDAHDKNIY